MAGPARDAADVVVDGKKAWATRTERGREVDDIGFVLDAMAG